MDLVQGSRSIELGVHTVSEAMVVECNWDSFCFLLAIAAGAGTAGAGVVFDGGT